MNLFATATTTKTIAGLLLLFVLFNNRKHKDVPFVYTAVKDRS